MINPSAAQHPHACQRHGHRSRRCRAIAGIARPQGRIGEPEHRRGHADDGDDRQPADQRHRHDLQRLRQPGLRAARYRQHRTQRGRPTIFSSQTAM